MKIKKIITTQQSMTVEYDDNKSKRMRFNVAEFNDMVKKNGLKFTLEGSTNNRKVYVAEVKAETSNDIEDNATPTESVNENVLTDRNDTEKKLNLTDFKGLGLKIAKTVYQKMKMFNPDQLDLVVRFMNKNGLKQVNEKVLNELEL